MKFKKENKKNNAKMQTKTAAQANVIEEYFYMIPKKVTVKELVDAVSCVEEDAKEIWTELDLMELVLPTDSLIFENMMDTFTEDGDAQFLKEHGVEVVYAVSYDTKDKAQVKAVLEELYTAFGGFMASDTEDLQPVFEIAAF